MKGKRSCLQLQDGAVVSIAGCRLALPHLLVQQPSLLHTVVSLGKGLEKQWVFRRHYFLFLFFVIANGCTAFQLDPLPRVFSWVEAGGIAWFGGQGKRREGEGTGRRVSLGHTADK